MIDLFIAFISQIFTLQPFYYFIATLSALCIILLIRRICSW